MIVIVPRKAAKHVKSHKDKFVFHTHELDLMEHKLVGPFDFRSQGSPVISKIHWTQLTAVARAYGIDTDGIGEKETRSQT